MFLFETSRLCAAAGILAGTIAFCTASPAWAETVRHETHFTVSFAGLEIGKARFKIQFDDSSYSLEGTGRTTGLAEWFAPGTGEVSSSGVLIRTAIQPENHRVSVTERKEPAESVTLSFVGNAVKDVEVVSAKPRTEKKAPKYVPVEASHLASVIDPASSMIIPMEGRDARSGRRVCNQRFPIYDGETRYDIVLRFKSTKPVKTTGYEGYAYVCQMRYVPVAGHKKNHRSVREMAENKGMEIWLAPMGGVSVFTPIKIVVGTKYGRFTAAPTYFGKVQ